MKIIGFALVGVLVLGAIAAVVSAIAACVLSGRISREQDGIEGE